MSSSARRISAAELAIVVGLALVTIVAASWRIGNPALWLDEHYSLAVAQESWSDMFGRFWGLDTHRPIYYALLKAWMSVFGSDAATARMLGVVLAGATVPVIWGLGRILGGQRIGLLAAALLAVSPLFIAQARELRMYPLFSLSLALTTLSLALIAMRGNSIGYWALFVVSAVLAFYAQATGLLIMPLAGLFLLILVVARLREPQILVGFGVASLLWLALALPGLWPAIFHTRDTLANFWIPAPSLTWVYSQFVGVYPYPAWAKPIIGIVLLAGFFLAWRNNKRAFWLLAVMVIGMPLMLLALSYIRPILIVRVFVWTSVIAAVVMAFAVSKLPKWPLAAAVAVIVALQVVTLLPHYPTQPMQTDLDMLASELETFDRQNDIMLIGPQSFEFNLRRNHPWLRDVDMRAFSYGDITDLSADMLWSELVLRSDAMTMPLEGSRLFLLHETNPKFPVPAEDNLDAALAALHRRGQVERVVDVGRVRLEILDISAQSLPGLPDGGTVPSSVESTARP
nr:glycosyltransferase family 39 protein [uncultured Devosia sp.]